MTLFIQSQLKIQKIYYMKLESHVVRFSITLTACSLQASPRPSEGGITSVPHQWDGQEGCVWGG